MNRDTTLRTGDSSTHSRLFSLRRRSSAPLLACVLSLLLAAQGCCPGAGTSPTPVASDFCDRSRTTEKPTPAKSEAPVQSDSKFRASRFGGPYPCQQVRKKLNNFAAYEQVGLDYVEVCDLTCDLLRKSVEANQKRAAKLKLPASVQRFQRYNYVINNEGRLLVAVWTKDVDKLADIQKRHGVKYISDVKGAMVDFGAEEQFDPTDDKLPAGTTAEVSVPGARTAKSVGLFDASSKHFRIVQGNDADFSPETWMTSTVAYAGELIVDTTAKNAAGEPDACFYLNNGSGTYQPDAHYLRTVGRYVKEKLTIAPRYLQNPYGGKDEKGEVWTFRVDSTSAIFPPKMVP